MSPGLMMEERTISDRDDYESFIESRAETEIQEAKEYLRHDTDRDPEDPDAVKDAVDETLWENVEAMRMFTHDDPALWGTVIYYHQGGITEYTDLGQYLTRDGGPRGALKTLAAACVHYDLYKEVVETLY